MNKIVFIIGLLLIFISNVSFAIDNNISCLLLFWLLLQIKSVNFIKQRQYLKNMPVK